MSPLTTSVSVFNVHVNKTMEDEHKKKMLRGRRPIRWDDDPRDHVGPTTDFSQLPAHWAPHMLVFEDTSVEAVDIREDVMLNASKQFLHYFRYLRGYGGAIDRLEWLPFKAEKMNALNKFYAKTLMDTLRTNSNLKGSKDFEQILLRFEVHNKESYPRFYEMVQNHDGETSCRSFLNKSSDVDITLRYHIDQPGGGSFSSLKEPVFITTSWSIKKDVYPAELYGGRHHGTKVIHGPVKFFPQRNIQRETVFGARTSSSGEQIPIMRIGTDEDEKATSNRAGQINKAYLAPHRAPNKLAEDEIRIVVAGLTGKGAVHVRIKEGDITGPQIATNLDAVRALNSREHGSTSLRRGERTWSFYTPNGEEIVSNLRF